MEACGIKIINLFISKIKELSATNTIVVNLTNQIEIIDLRTLSPLDEQTIFESVQKTNRCLVLTEEPTNNSFARSLAGLIQEKCFAYLDAPVLTLGSENMPAIPLNSTLEQTMLPSVEKVKEKVVELLSY